MRIVLTRLIKKAVADVYLIWDGPERRNLHAAEGYTYLPSEQYGFVSFADSVRLESSEVANGNMTRRGAFMSLLHRSTIHPPATAQVAV